MRHQLARTVRTTVATVSIAVVLLAASSCAPQGPDGTGGGGTTTTTLPVQPLTVSMIKAGSDTACALLTDGTVRCWGRVATVDVGGGSFQSVTSSLPVQVDGLTDVTQIAVGVGHRCAIRSDHTVWCWGSNRTGQLGRGGPIDSNGYVDTVETRAPGIVDGVTGAVQVAAGNGTSCAIVIDGRVQCWGSNNRGQMGNGSVVNSSPTPTYVTGISNAISITAGSDFTCAVLAQGTAKCWGNNSAGLLGNGSTGQASLGYLEKTPVSVAGLTQAITISTSARDSSVVCALLSTGTVKCWGGNNVGQLGTGTNGSTSLVPVGVSSIASATSIAVSSLGACALLIDGTAKCWGYNASGELGNGTTTNSPSPIAVAAIADATAIAASSNTGYVLTATGSAKSWGYNSAGQLGNGTFADSPSPVLVQLP